MNTAVFSNPKAVAVTAAVSILLLGYLDYITGWEFGFFVFYFLPIVYASWYCGRAVSLGIATLSAVVWFFADNLLQSHYSSQFYTLWNSLIRLCVFVMAVFMIDKMRKSLNAERKIATDLRGAMAQIKTMSGLIPICSWCKQIRNDQGYWEQIEKYIEEHSDAGFTHGICEACARKLYPEIYGIENHVGK